MQWNCYVLHWIDWTLGRAENNMTNFLLCKFLSASLRHNSWGAISQKIGQLKNEGTNFGCTMDLLSEYVLGKYSFITYE